MDYIKEKAEQDLMDEINYAIRQAEIVNGAVDVILNALSPRRDYEQTEKEATEKQ